MTSHSIATWNRFTFVSHRDEYNGRTRARARDKVKEEDREETKWKHTLILIHGKICFENL